jgi:dipeptidyl aminopeptidase/acylaminoacyl peptidase
MHPSAAAVVGAMTLGLVAGAPIAAPGANGPISFVGLRVANPTSEIYSVAADGTGRVNLTNDPAADESPAVSPDGRQIAFVKARDGYDVLYVMNADGSGRHRVCPQASQPAGPCVLEGGGQGAIGDVAWSPTGFTLGFRVVFPGTALCYSPAEGDYVVDLASGQARQLAYGLLGPLRFSPHGRFLAWGSHSCKSADLVAIRRADSGTETTAVNGLLVGWAPRGLRVLYERGRKDYQGGYTTVYLATIDPFGGHRWTLKRTPEAAPAWSANGRRIAFFRETGRRQGLYVVHARRHDARRLLRFTRAVSLSAWSPNGDWIAFGGAGGTYFVRSNGKGLRRVSGTPLLSTYSPLIWSADSSRFAFVDSDGVVRVVSPPQQQAVPVTTAASDLDVCRMAIGLPVCQIAWAGDRLLFASHGPQTAADVAADATLHDVDVLSPLFFERTAGSRSAPRVLAAATSRRTLIYLRARRNRFYRVDCDPAGGGSPATCYAGWSEDRWAMRWDAHTWITGSESPTILHRDASARRRSARLWLVRAGMAIRLHSPGRWDIYKKSRLIGYSKGPNGVPAALMWLVDPAPR